MTATIVGRYIAPFDGVTEIVKVNVTLDDGTVRCFRMKGLPDNELLARAEQMVQTDIDAAIEAEENAPVERDDIDAALAQLAKDGKIDAEYDSWSKVETSAIGVG